MIEFLLAVTLCWATALTASATQTDDRGIKIFRYAVAAVLFFGVLIVLPMPRS